MIYVYTSILGGFDTLRAPLVPPEPGVRFICFTDVPVLPDCPPWEFRPAHRIEKDSSRTSRIPKILPHLMLPADADYSIWIDGNFQIRKPASEIINQELRFDDWAAHPHPARGCIYEEAALLMREKAAHPDEWPTLDASLLLREIEAYRADGYPEGLGNLTANGMIIRRHSAEVARVNELWWRLFTVGCGRDQLSFPAALRQIGTISLNRMPHYHDVYNSPLMRFGWHAAWKNEPRNVESRPERERVAARVARLREVVGDGGYEWRIY